MKNSEMKVSVCAIAREENNYLKEWVEYYKKIGFDSIYLFDNNTSDGEEFSEAISDYITSKFVIVDKTYRGKHDKLYQIDAYHKFYKEYGNIYDWVLFVDIDEFIEFENTDNIKKFLSENQKFNDFDMIRFCWKCFTDNNLVDTNNNFSIKRFTTYTEDYSTQCKSIIRGGLELNKFNCHGVYESWVKACNALGEPCYNGSVGNACHIGPEKIWNGAWINHYRFKTISEFLNKMKKWEWLERSKTLLNLNAFFSMNEVTNDKINFLKKNGIDYEAEKVIISFTSWKKRIDLANHVFNLMLNQTRKPNKIILNLSIDEFPRKEKELPFKLTEIVNNNDGICKINWVQENNTVWKKFMPILDKYPNDVIIPIDDDIEYPKNYVDVMYSEYLRRGKMQPIVCYPNLRENNIYSHSGPFSLVKKEFFGKYLTEIYNELISKKKNIHWQSDEVYTYCVLLNKKRYYFTNKINGKMLYDSSEENKKNAYSNYNVGWRDLMITIKNELNNFISSKYKLNPKDILKNDINVCFTTWKLRENAVPKMLESIKKETLQPKRIMIFLSETEYNHKVPDIIQELYNKNIITDIEWVPGNTFSYKRWEVVKKYNDCYNIFVDDDILYDENHIKELYETALKNQGCEIVWSSLIENYIGTKRSYLKNNEGMHKSKKLQTLSGVSCYPPFTFPVEMFNHIKERDTWCTRCDDSWNRAWLLKNNTDIVRVHDRSKKAWKVIDGTQSVGIWNTENKLLSDKGVENIVRNFANALICADAVKEAQELWPEFNIYGCCSKGLLDKEHKNNEKEVKNSFASKPIISPKQLSYIDSMYNYDEIVMSKKDINPNCGSIKQTVVKKTKNIEHKQIHYDYYDDLHKTESKIMNDFEKKKRNNVKLKIRRIKF